MNNMDHQTLYIDTQVYYNILEPTIINHRLQGNAMNSVALLWPAVACLLGNYM